jgi:hypothetical protein
LKREHFEHVLRAAADIANDEIVVIGSQAILAQFPDAPDPLTSSLEADVYPRRRPEGADEIDGAIGDGSSFHEAYGYYAHGVGPETLTAPAGWEQRLVKIEIASTLPSHKPATAWALEIHDLLLSKLAAGRPRDIDFAREAIRAGMADPQRLQRGIDLFEPEHRSVVSERLDGVLKQVAIEPNSKH